MCECVFELPPLSCIHFRFWFVCIRGDVREEKEGGCQREGGGIREAQEVGFGQCGEPGAGGDARGRPRGDGESAEGNTGEGREGPACALRSRQQAEAERHQYSESRGRAVKQQRRKSSLGGVRLPHSASLSLFAPDCTKRNVYGSCFAWHAPAPLIATRSNSPTSESRLASPFLSLAPTSLQQSAQRAQSRD